MAFNGTLLRCRIFPTANATTPKLLSEETKTDMNFQKEFFETTSKDSGAWRSRISSYKQAEVQVECFVNYAASATHLSYAEVWDLFNGSEPVKVEFSTGIATNEKHVGFFHISKMDVSAPTEQGATMSMSFTSTGAVSSDPVIVV